MHRLRHSGIVPFLLVTLAGGCSPAPDSTQPMRPIQTVAMPSSAGSLAARLVRAQSGTVVLSWLEAADGGHALRFAIRRDAGWSAVQTVASGANWFVNWADFPSVVPIDAHFWAAHWLVRRPAGGYAYDIVTAVSNDAGANWSAPRRPHTDDTDSEHGFVTIFAHAGRAGLVWLDGRNTAQQHDSPDSGMTLRAASLGSDGSIEDAAQIDALICDCCSTDVTVTADGPVAVYRDRSGDEIRDVYAARLSADGWQSAGAVAADGWQINACPVNGPVVASRGQRVTVAWFTAADEQPRVRLARSSDAAGRFADAVDVAEGRVVGRVGLVVLADGTAVVSWLRSNAAGFADLMLTPVTPVGRVGEAVQVAADALPFSVPQMVRDGDGVLLIWTVRRDGESELAGARVPFTSFDG